MRKVMSRDDHRRSNQRHDSFYGKKDLTRDLDIGREIP